MSRDIFVNDEVCRLELERIFDRTWMFLAHETELGGPGDYVRRRRPELEIVLLEYAGGTEVVEARAARTSSQAPAAASISTK